MPPMVATDLTARLKREDCKRTKHHCHFSNWKVLVGPCDWEDYWVGKEGAERYRVHNLPGNETPGVYELGVGALRRGIDPDYMVPVYLGQADSVRTRLQQYGRTGAHLGKGCSVGNYPSEGIRKGPGLFEEMLGRGYSIVYRWAPMGTKSEALKTESQLLNTFDYAWNTSINGARRPADIIRKLEKISSKRNRFANIVQRLLPFRQKQVGIRINSSKLVSSEEKFSDYADRESRNLIPRVFKFGRSQPRLVGNESGITQENTLICGVAMGDGSLCGKAPVQGRKRCAEHKGMRVTGSITVRISDKNVDSRCSVISNREVVSDESGITQEHTEVCGVAAGDGSICKTPPVQGRKRCAKHKGMRIRGSITVRLSDKNVSECSVLSNKELDSHDASNLEYEPVELPPVHVSESSTSICGFILTEGSPCRTEPIRGRKRCDGHKGRRIQKSYSKSVKEEKVEICA